MKKQDLALVYTALERGSTQIRRPSVFKTLSKITNRLESERRLCRGWVDAAHATIARKQSQQHQHSPPSSSQTIHFYAAILYWKIEWFLRDQFIEIAIIGERGVDEKR